MMISIESKFIGTTSLGFNNGENYSLLVNIRLSWINHDYTKTIEIISKDNKLRCEYGSIDSFLKYWIINKINDDFIKSNKGFPPMDKDMDVEIIKIKKRLYQSMRDHKILSLIG